MSPRVKELEAEIARLKAENAELRQKRLPRIVKICSGCHSVQTPDGRWAPLDRFLELYAGVESSHGYCEACAARLLEEALDGEDGAP